MQATATGCKPVLEARTTAHGFDQVSERRSTCQSLMSFVYNDYLPSHHVDALLIDARWGAEDLASLQRTLQWAAGHGTKVVLFGPTVEYDAPLPRLLAISIQSKDLSVPRRHMLMENWPLDVQMARLAAGESG